MGKSLLEDLGSRVPGIGKTLDNIVQGIGAGLMTSVAGHAALHHCQAFKKWSAEEAKALEAKDAYAKRHSENVMHYATGIAEAMKIVPNKIRVIRRAGMIHDIGKIGIPDAILSKPDTLTRREHSVVEQHPLIAVRILNKMEFLEREMAIVRHHHERWNGQGSPDGLSATSIPLGARIMAVADTLDALTTDRSYHKSKSVAEAVNIISDSSGYEFDPKVVKGMLNWVDEIVRQAGKDMKQLVPEDLSVSQEHQNQSLLEPAVTASAT